MKENKNINNAANNNANNEGGFVMTTGTMTMDVFAGTVKEALAVYFEDCTVELQEVKKNNGLTLHGVSIRECGSNLAPTIYMKDFFKAYQDGRSFVDIVRDIARVYEAHRVPPCFGLDTGIFTDYGRVKDRICFKVVNTDTLFEVAKYNTPILLPGSVCSMESVVSDLFFDEPGEEYGICRAEYHYQDGKEKGIG